jgi:hypothetical protein
MRLQGDGLLDSQCGHGRALGHNTLQHRRLGIARLCGAFVRYVRRAVMATDTAVHDGEAEPGALSRWLRGEEGVEEGVEDALERGRIHAAACYRLPSAARSSRFAFSMAWQRKDELLEHRFAC